MSKPRLCKFCHQRPAAVPDRDEPGRPTARVCRECHAQRLMADLDTVVAANTPNPPSDTPVQ